MSKATQDRVLRAYRAYGQSNPFDNAYRDAVHDAFREATAGDTPEDARPL